MPLDRLEIARRLREVRQLLDLAGGNRFRARAYEAGARALESTTADVSALVRTGRLTDIPGVGPGLEAVISQLHDTGESPLLETLRAEFPPGLVELSKIPGITRKRLHVIHEGLGVASLSALKAACERGRLRTLPGFGPKTEQRILAAIDAYEHTADKVLLGHAVGPATSLRDHVRAIPGCSAAEISGAIRRSLEIVPGIDVVAAFERFTDRRFEPPIEAIARFPLVTRIEEERPDGCVLRLADGQRATVTFASPEDFGAALLATTGTPEHCARLAALIASPSRHVATRPDHDAESPSGGEARIYAEAGLPWIPPELRDDAGEFEDAIAGDRFDDLIAADDIRGMVHCHTTYSDGRNSIEAMCRAAEAIGMRYITITDHSPTASYAGGVTEARLAEQWDEIDRVQDSVGIRILRGTESDILADGSLDYPPSVLERFDVVIASVHVRHSMNEDEMTRRVVTAMRNPVFKIWGHALGRLLKRREPFACRVEDILDAVSESRAAVEINGDFHRLDLEPRWIREARKRNIRFVISTDAHSTRDFENLRFGVGIARRGGVRRSEVLNALEADAFSAAVRPRSS